MRFNHEFDGMGTIHNMPFLADKNFQRHQSRAIKAGEFDYNIPLRLHQAIWCAKLARNLSNEGIFVELGTGRGYVMSAICSDLSSETKEFQNRSIYLFDTFIPYRLDSSGNPDESLGINPNYSKSFEEVKENFAEWPNVILVKGGLPGTLIAIENQPISFIHIDLNSPSIEIQCLTQLWHQILPGAPILIDDYAYTGYEDTLARFNEFADKMNFMILTTATGQGIAFKPSHIK
jgi:hypothetical protein